MKKDLSVIVESVRKRGYIDGWTPEQIVARNVAKLSEELGELAELIQIPELTKQSIERAASMSKQAFESRGLWGDTEIDPANIERIRKEIADIFVVMAVLSDAFAKYTGTEFDPIATAVEKARADESRGTRYSAH